MTREHSPDLVAFVFNGQRRSIAAGSKVAELVDAGWGRAVAVARNRTVVPRSEWDAVCIEAGDEIEIVRPIQGG